MNHLSSIRSMTDQPLWTAFSKNGLIIKLFAINLYPLDWGASLVNGGVKPSTDSLVAANDTLCRQEITNLLY
jgi:hypothetical protein